MKILNHNQKSDGYIIYIWDNLFYFMIAKFFTGFDHY